MGRLGLSGTHALILRRTNSSWTLERADLEGCTIVINVKGYQLTTAQFAAGAASLPKNCEPHKGATYFTENSAIIQGFRARVSPIVHSADLGKLWAALVNNGATTLPPEVARKGLLLDGHGFVVEFRSAAEYRVSQISCHERDTTADRQLLRIGQLLLAQLPDARWITCDA
jgi:hypothetical protein